LALRQRRGKFKASAAAAAADPAVLTTEELGAPLGTRATLVQFSTEFCANCPPTRRMLGQVAREHDGVELVEVDAAARLDLARRLNVYATPTILVLGPDGAVASRASGQPRKSDVLAAVGGVLGAGAP
jgi:thiol-disulfide isomerase/thioredoxin